MKTLGRYELLRLLARGGMAEVFLARRRVGDIEKRLVLKLMRSDKVKNPRSFQLFVREAKITMAFVQQNIVPVFDFGRFGDDVFIVMEYIEGTDLGSVLHLRRSGMSPLLAAYVASESCKALEYAHTQTGSTGFVHRDVKPGNILLSWGGEVKLADFGVAAALGQDEHRVVGTLGYMPPEQARGDLVDERCDIYALGLVLWEMLAGRPVRDQADRAQLLAAARSGALPPIGDDIDDELACIIAKATHADPEQRYTSSLAMGEALDVFLVEHRSKHPGPTPAKQLAEFLAPLRRESEVISVDIPPGEAARVVTFLDDGLAEVLAHNTAHSFIETSDAARERRRTSVPPPAAGAPVTVTPRGASGDRRLLYVLAAASVTIGAVTLFGRSSGSSRAPAVAAPTPPAPAPRIEPDAAPPPTTVATPTVDLPVAAPRPAPSRPRSAPTLPEPPPARRTVVIGATPWANFTVDGGSTTYETPATIELGVGKHTLSFHNPQLGIRRTTTLEVPADGTVRHVEKMVAETPSPPPE